ncbi:MAG: hypothetical protein ACREH9_09865 [Pseudomonadota bacterium]
MLTKAVLILCAICGARAFDLARSWNRRPGRARLLVPRAKGAAYGFLLLAAAGLVTISLDLFH